MAAVPPGIPPIPINILGSFNSVVEFDNLLVRIGLNQRCRNRLIADEGITTAQDLAETRPKDLKAFLENINKLFGSKPVDQRIYFAPRLMSKIVSICVYFRALVSMFGSQEPNENKVLIFGIKKDAPVGPRKNMKTRLETPF